MLGTVAITKPGTGDPSCTTRSLHGDEVFLRPSVGLAAWPSIRGGRQLMLVASPVTRLASRSYLGSYGDGGKLHAQKGIVAMQPGNVPKLLFLLPSQRPVAQVFLVLKKSPHPIALDMNLIHLLDCTRENPSGLAVWPCVSITRAVSLRTET